MARKLCPACKKVNAGSATACSCGHTFPAESIVLPQEGKRCPVCGTGNPRAAATCHCGFHFDDNPDEVRGLLEGRAVTGLILLIAAPFGIATGVGVILVGLLKMGMALAAFSITGALKGVVMRQNARRGLRELAISHPPLPAARVVTKREGSDVKD